MGTKNRRLVSSAPRSLQFNSTTVPIRLYQLTIDTLSCQSKLPHSYAFSEEGQTEAADFDGRQGAGRGGTRLPWTLSPTTDAIAYSLEWDRDSAR